MESLVWKEHGGTGTHLILSMTKQNQVLRSMSGLLSHHYYMAIKNKVDGRNKVNGCRDSVLQEKFLETSPQQYLTVTKCAS